MRLIHCSDLHLDSKMESNLSADQARERNGEICTAFARMVRWACDNGVAGVLLAGDLFDTCRVSEKTADFVLDTLAQAGDLPFYYLRGNHDDSSAPFAGKTLPANLHCFGKAWTSYDLGDVTITGLELDRDNWNTCYDDLKLEEDRVNIVMLHGQTSTQPGEELVALPRLKGRHIDYLALGHIHSYQSERLDQRGQWCYCGCLEGRGFDECGEKGFVLLNVEKGRVEGALMPFATRRLHEVRVDISDCVTVTQLQQALTAAAAGISADSLVKFTLTGTYTPETQKDLGFLTKLMSQRFWFVKIKDESRFRIEKADYEHDISLKGQFIRLVMASDKTEEQKAQIICAGLQALTGEEVTL